MGPKMTNTSPQRCAKCGLITDHVSGPRGPERCPYDRLREALGPVPPTAAEDHTLHWLAGVDRGTVETLESLFIRLRGGPGGH